MKKVAFLTLWAVGAVAALSPAAPAEHAKSMGPRAAAATRVSPVPDATRSSASYSLAAESLDEGGAAVATSVSGTYTFKDTSLGAVGVRVASANGTYTLKGGYAGQLYEVLGLAVTSLSPSVNERASIQLGAAPQLDDTTLLPALDPSTLSWSVPPGGALASVSTAGVATAASVYQNTATAATVRATSGGLTGTGALVVRNVNPDDYGTYANDGIDDAWQERYFGDRNPLAGPNVDADGTGQTNLFKFLAGLDPTDPTARFVLTIAAVAGQPTQKTLTFSPVYSGRTYTVQYTTSLTQPNWTALTGASVSVNGTTETVTDPNAGGGSSGSAQRFYRVQVSLP